MKARPIISSNDSLRELLNSGALWRGNDTDLVANRQIVAPFLIPEIDLTLAGGLQFGQIHEWQTRFFGEEGLAGAWQTKKLFPPHLIICSLLKNALKRSDLSNDRKVIVWIGRDCWPSVHQLNLLSLNLDWNWQNQVLLIDPESKQERLSAFRACLGCAGVLATIGDISNFSLIATRQLQFAARAGGGMGFLLRREENSKVSQTVKMAQTKWLVEPIVAQRSDSPLSDSPLKGARALNGIISWRLSLLKAPGLQAEKNWEIELNQNELLLTAKEAITPAKIKEIRYAS